MSSRLQSRGRALLSALTVCAVAAACAESTAVEGRAAPRGPAITAPRFSSVPCRSRYLAWGQGLHGITQGYMTPLAPTGNCDDLQTGVEYTMSFAYRFSLEPQDTSVIGTNSTGHWTYLTLVYTDGRVVNQLVSHVPREQSFDWVEYTVSATFTATADLERAILSVGHAELPEDALSGYADREFVLHLWREIPGTALTASTAGSTVTLHWTSDHRFMIHKLYKSCDGGDLQIVETVAEPVSTSFTRTQTLSTAACVYLVVSHFALDGYFAIGSNIEESTWIERYSNLVTAGEIDSVSITTADPLPSAVKGSAYSQTLAATGGFGSHGWSIAPGSSLPPGLSLAESGVLFGTPTATGTYTFTVRAAATYMGAATKVFHLTVAPPPVVVLSEYLFEGTASVPYSAQLAAQGGPDVPPGTPPYTWSVASGSTLPSGLSLSSSGLLSGTPLVGGSYTFGVRATATDGSYGTQTLHVSFYDAPTVSISGPSRVRSGKTCTWTAVASGGNGYYSYQWYKNGAAASTSSTFTTTINSNASLSVTVSSAGATTSESYLVVVSPAAPAGCTG